MAASRSAVGGRNDAEINRDFGHGTERTDTLAFDHGEQLGLERHRHLTDLVEKEGAAAGRLEQSSLIRSGVGKRTAHMAEEFAFQQSYLEWPRS